jgi:hypothetical protein
VILFDDYLLKRQDDEPWRRYGTALKMYECRVERPLANAALPGGGQRDASLHLGFRIKDSRKMKHKE